MLKWRRQDLLIGATKRKKNNFKGDTTKYQVYAISSDTNYGADVPEYAQYAMLGFLLDTQPDEVKCQSLSGSEMTWKIKQLEVERRLSQCPMHSWRRQCLPSVMVVFDRVSRLNIAPPPPLVYNAFIFVDAYDIRRTKDMLNSIKMML